MNKNNALFVFPVIFDDGNTPFMANGLASLALAMPLLRAEAVAGDMVVGLAPDDSGRIVFVFPVEEVILWGDYARLCRSDAAFAGRIPANVIATGDALYQGKHALPAWAGRTAEDYAYDVTTGKNVLLSRHCVYFGRGDERAVFLPAHLANLRTKYGYQRRTGAIVADFAAFWAGEKMPAGSYGRPQHEPVFEGFDFVMSCSTLSASADGCGSQVAGRVAIDDVRDAARANDRFPPVGA